MRLFAIAFECSVLWFRQCKWYNTERVSLHHSAICFNLSVIIIENGHLFRHAAIALNKPTSVLIIAQKCDWSCDQNYAILNQKFIFVATLRIVGNRWLWSIMLGNANEARKTRAGYSRSPTEFLILETQLQATMIIVGISKCTQHVCESGLNSRRLRW